eukprot:TRINITY_DN10844_c0_g1_i1.p1 TRINITY_DN10844_c0_g1~~TRINITY_DN10844_c0_g1_i1.p1  ORF type:complete len:188 (+),score=47.89 TRINITY_DN10844_c0_g1_i1:56-619(+)
MSIKFEPITAVQGAYIAYPPRYNDERGFFQEKYNDKKYGEVVKQCQQTSFSYSHKNVIRGLHCSKYGKLVQCIRGKLVDVFIDLRRDSPTYLKWAAVELNENEAKQVFVPGGCGHGFFSYEDHSILLYTQEGTFDPPTEMNVLWSDPVLGIQWPQPVDGGQYIISEKDRSSPTLQEAQRLYDERNKK